VLNRKSGILLRASYLRVSLEYKPRVKRTTSGPLEAGIAQSLLRKTLIVVCAYNEAKALPTLLESLKGRNVLVVDDGSTDGTADLFRRYEATALTHSERQGKAASLQDAIQHALEAGYEIIVEIDADVIPEPSSLERLLDYLADPSVGAVSVRQIPVGPPNVAYHIDELLWATLSSGKRVQMSRDGSSHLGAAMTAFKPKYLVSVTGSVNDDEEIGQGLAAKGLRTVFADDLSVFFDASSSVGHIMERRKRMIVGHCAYPKSTAPSMEISVAGLAVFKAVLEAPRRVVWALPALFVECYSRLMAWRDTRRPLVREKYRRWVTTFEKNHTQASSPDTGAA